MSGTAVQLVVSMLVLTAVPQPALHESGRATLDGPLQLARAATQTYRSNWKDNSDDKGADKDKPMAGSKGSHHGGGPKSGAGGYNPQRVHRFWSHYRGAHPGPKEKPLEKQPREAK